MSTRKVPAGRGIAGAAGGGGTAGRSAASLNVKARLRYVEVRRLTPSCWRRGALVSVTAVG